MKSLHLIQSARQGTREPSLFENLWTVTDVARFLQVEKKTVYDWVHKRSIPFHKLNRLVRFKPREIETWLTSKGESHGNR